MQEQKTNLEKIINSSIEEIKQKMMTICENGYEDDLNFQSAISFIGQIKETVSDFGCQIVKSYFESRDEPVPSITSDNKRYLNKGKSTKEVITSLGKISITRSYYQHRSGGSSLFPLDNKLGVMGELLMPDVKEVVLFSCAYNTPEESSRLLEKCSFIKLHPTQIKRAVTSTNEFIETSDSGSFVMENVRKNETIPESELLVCSLDGVNVLLNENGKKKGRPLERPIKNENISASAYKNVMCGSISHYKIVKNEGGKTPERVDTKYIARMPEKYYPAFKREFEEEIRSADPGFSVAKLIITDAHKSISGYLKDNPAFSGYHRIIDFYHASEHLSLLAEAIFGKSSAKAKSWYLNYRDILKNQEQGVIRLIRSVEYYFGSQSFNKGQEKEIRKHLGYFKKHKKFMRYANYAEKGWPIGSGVIEAACKSVVKQRMCRSGQRWSIKGGQAVLNLRAVVKSNRWEGFWSELTKSYYMKNAA
jgi:hypothetical protein